MSETNNPQDNLSPQQESISWLHKRIEDFRDKKRTAITMLSVKGAALVAGGTALGWSNEALQDRPLARFLALGMAAVAATMPHDVLRHMDASRQEAVHTAELLRRSEVLPPQAYSVEIQPVEPVAAGEPPVQPSQPQ